MLRNLLIVAGFAALALTAACGADPKLNTVPVDLGDHTYTFGEIYGCEQQMESFVSPLPDYCEKIVRDCLFGKQSSNEQVNVVCKRLNMISQQRKTLSNEGGF